MEIEMKTLVVAAAISVVFTAPACAQFSGYRYRAPGAGAARDGTGGDRTTHRRAARQAPSDRSVGGSRWPGARYDEHGYYIDPNSRGRW
jgi:hypothetical protein